MAHSNADLVRDAIGAYQYRLQRGDLDALRHQYFAEDIRYHIPGRSPLGGDYEGVAQVLEMFGRLVELSGGYAQRRAA